MATPESNKFLDEVADWLLATRDRRLSFADDGSPVIVDVMGACKDFLRFQTQLERRKIPPGEWREHL